jgi:hypothetical protein
MDVNSGDYTSLTVTAAHIKSSLHSQTLNSTELHSVIMMPQFNSSAPKPTFRQAGVSKLHWLSQLTQLAWGPRYIASGRIQQETRFPNNPFIFTCLFVAGGTYLPSRCREMNVYCVHYSGFQTSYHNMVISLAELETKNDCAGEDQQQFTRQT